MTKHKTWIPAWLTEYQNKCYNNTQTKRTETIANLLEQLISVKMLKNYSISIQHCSNKQNNHTTAETYDKITFHGCKDEAVFCVCIYDKSAAYPYQICTKRNNWEPELLCKYESIIVFLLNHGLDNPDEKTYDEYDTEEDLNRQLKYWSNAAGDIYCPNQPELHSPASLPFELQQAYKKLWNERSGCLEYLVEYQDNYYVAVISEFDNDQVNPANPTYDKLKKQALRLYETALFDNTRLIIGNQTGVNKCHEIIFLIPAMEKMDIFCKIETSIDIWADRLCTNK